LWKNEEYFLDTDTLLSFRIEIYVEQKDEGGFEFLSKICTQSGVKFYACYIFEMFRACKLFVELSKSIQEIIFFEEIFATSKNYKTKW